MRAIISDLPVNQQMADLLVKLLMRMEKKLITGGVDDSNGIVGRLAGEIVNVLEEFAQIDPACIDAFKPLCKKEYCFGWEDSLVCIYDERGYQNTRRNKKFIDSKTADLIIEKMYDALGHDIVTQFTKHGSSAKDMIRFMPVSKTCQDARKKRGLTIKQIAASIKVPQYRLKDIEENSFNRIIRNILERYVEFLDLKEWFNEWIKNNQDVYKLLDKEKV
ncbi:MAG: helix-turn-helix domain-containing protein [Candidatus Omnitrophica bacterium]|nr:helix-turn-helix domain-containing protein [Candidatus Omnitrophota bacterium]